LRKTNVICIDKGVIMVVCLKNSYPTYMPLRMAFFWDPTYMPLGMAFFWDPTLDVQIQLAILQIWMKTKTSVLNFSI